MVRPRFVKAVRKNGEIVREFPVEVIKERICSPKTLNDIQEILEMVVSKGLGKKAGCKDFKVSGQDGYCPGGPGTRRLSWRPDEISYQFLRLLSLRPAEVQLYRRDTKVRPAGFGRRALWSGIQRDRPKRHGERGISRCLGSADSASVFVPDVLTVI